MGDVILLERMAILRNDQDEWHDATPVNGLDAPYILHIYSVSIIGWDT